jgi:hypothetical protein
MKKHLAFYDIAATAATVKTFDGRTYKVKGVVVIDDETGTPELLSKVYYRVRSVRKKNRTIAKRRNENDKLRVV